MRKNLKICIAIVFSLYFSFYFNNINAQKNRIYGDYILSAITLENNSEQDSLKAVPVFEDASINCLLNSEWEFEDAAGFYKIVTNACTKGARQISWKFFSLKGSNYFQFNRTAAFHGLPANNNYVFEVQSSDKKTFTLRYPILFADKQNAILFTFTKQEQ